MTQCKKDDDPTPDELIIGIWQAVEVDGEAVPADEIFTFEFEESSVFEWCYTDETESYCYEGEWNWLGANRDKINIEITDEDNYSYSINIEIERLDNTHLDLILDDEPAKFIRL
jgi:hypothetical protein